MVRDLFIREDLSKPENRINVALFGMMTVPSFREWLLPKLGLPPDAVVYPPMNVANEDGAGRPDFVVKLADTDKTLAWIEVECGVDWEQIERFRRILPEERVIAVWGHPGRGCDLSLDEIAGFLEVHRVSTEPQIRFNSTHLARLIREGVDGHAGALKTAVVSDKMRDSTFLVELKRVLGDKLNFDISRPVRPREVGANTRGADGYSVRVFSPNSKISDHSVSVLFRTGGRPDIYFQSAAKMRKYLPGRLEQVEQLVALVREMGADMLSASENGRVSVPLAVAEENVEPLAAILVAMAW